jgi:hypothetical protein
MYEECSENGTVGQRIQHRREGNVKEIQKKERTTEGAARGAVLYSEREGNARVGDAPAATAAGAASEGDEGEGAPGEKEKMRDESPAPTLRPLPPPSAPGALAKEVSAADGEPPLLLGLVKRRWCVADAAIDIAELCGCCGVCCALCGVDSREAEDKCMGESAVCKPSPPSANTSEGVGLAGDNGNRCWAEPPAPATAATGPVRDTPAAAAATLKWKELPWLGPECSGKVGSGEG